MPPSTESSTHLSPTEKAFVKFLELRDGDGADFDTFCGERPELAEGLRRLHERWRAFDDAMSSGFRGDAIATSTSADESAERLLCGLRRDAPDDSRFVVRNEVGRGGMGRVVKVWDRDLRRSLAMKVLQGPRRRDPRSLARFLDEAFLTGQLEHPGIVPVHELGLDSEGNVYFTMSFVRGDTLQSVFELARKGDAGWTRERALGVLVRVCEAVGYAHSRGVVHRDLKPANIMVGPFGETYVMDWGLARILEQDTSEDDRDSAAVSRDLRSVRVDTGGDTPVSPLATMAGDIVGTPVYMSPEQAHGWVEQVGPRSDVYSIGAMLYQLLTGSRPYLSPGEKDSSEAVLRAVQSRAPRPVHALALNVPPELEAISDKAMSREPADRYVTTMELAADLRAFLEERVVGAFETGAVAELRKWMQRNRLLAIAIGAGTLAVLVGLAVSTLLFLDALQEKRRADANAGRLEVELRRSQLAQGRLAGTSGQLERAEQILWREHLLDPGPSTHWLLWELYARYPRRDSVSAPIRTYDSAVTPDGSLVLVPAGTDLYGETELLLLDSRSLYRLASLPAGEGMLYLDVDSDGRQALTAGRNGEVRVWDLLTRREVARTPPLGSDVWDVAYHAGTDRWLLACDDGVIRVLDRTGQVESELTSSVPVKSLAISPDGSLLASGGEDGSIRLWNDFSADPKHVLDAHNHWVVSLGFTADGRRLFAGSLDQTASAWDSETGERLWDLAPDNGDLHGLLVGGYDFFALGGWYRTDIHDAQSLAARSSVFVPGPVKRLALSAPDHLTIVHDAGLMNWDLESDRMALRFPDMQGWLAADYRDGLVLLGDRSGLVRLIEPGSDAPIAEWHEDGPVEGVALRPGGREAAVLSGKQVRVRNVVTGDVLVTFPGGGGASGSRLDFSPDGALILTTTTGNRGEPKWGGGDTPFELRDVESGEVVAAIGRPGETALALRFSPTGEFVVITTRTKSDEGNWIHWISSWSASGEERMHVAGKSAWNFAVSPDGTRLALGLWGRNVEVWDLEVAERTAILRGHTGNTWSADWHPTARDVLVSSSDDGTVRLWNAGTGENLLTLEVPGNVIRWVRFGADGETVLACGKGGETILFDLTYFDRHIAGNAARHVDLMQEELGDAVRGDEVLRWAEDVLARPWPRFAR